MIPTFTKKTNLAVSFQMAKNWLHKTARNSSALQIAFVAFLKKNSLTLISFEIFANIIFSLHYTFLDECPNKAQYLHLTPEAVMIRIITTTLRGERSWRVLCFTLWLFGPKLSRLSASQQQCDHYCVLLRLYKWMQQKHTIHEKESLTHLPQLSLEAVYWLSFGSYSTFSSHFLIFNYRPQIVGLLSFAFESCVS